MSRIKMPLVFQWLFLYIYNTMEIKILKTLTLTLIKTFFLSCFITWLCVQLMYSGISGSLEGGQAVGLFLIICIFMIFILTSSSVSVFLNLSEKIRTNKSYVALSFFFLPVISLFFSMWYFKMTPKTSNDYIELSMIIIPFFSIHTYYYFQFIKLLIDGDKK